MYVWLFVYRILMFCKITTSRSGTGGDRVWRGDKTGVGLLKRGEKGYQVVADTYQGGLHPDMGEETISLA